jgi:hypothetical protein
MSNDPMKCFEEACREVWFGARRDISQGYDQVVSAFDTFWKSNGQRLADIASRCHACLRFHAPDVTCEQYRTSADASEVERAAKMAREFTYWRPVPGDFIVDDKHYKPFNDNPPRPLDTARVAGGNWVCPKGECPQRLPIASPTAPICYTCGCTMVRV